VSAQHTPGPWAPITGFGYKAYVVPLSHVGRRIGGSENPTEDRDEFAQQICATLSDPYGRGDNEANARLIAAAPDLRSALQAILATLDDESDVCDGNDGQQLPNAAMQYLTQHGDQMRAAIAKAT
jgi:hypothetical protein